MGLLDQNKVESSSSCKNNGKKKKIFKGKIKGVEKKWHELKTLCGVRVLLYVDSEFNKDKNGDGSVRILPENPNECQEIIKDFINYDPKTTGKRKRDTDKCMNDNKMRKLCSGDVKEENQQVNFIDQEISTKLGKLSIEEIQGIERNLEPMFAMISGRIDQLMEKNRSSDPSAKGCCNENDVIMMNEFPSLPLEPKFDYPSSSSTTFFSCSSDLKNEYGMISETIDQLMEKDKSNDPSTKGCNEDDVLMTKEFPSLPLEPSKDFYNYSSALEKEFDYDINQWLNLPGLTNDGIVFEPFPDLNDFEFQGLNNYAGSFTDMIQC